jgi:hypothetical protein
VYLPGFGIFFGSAGIGIGGVDVQSSKMVHAALLLLMLEAVTADLVFTISLKRSTPNLQLSTSSPADYPICCDPPLGGAERGVESWPRLGPAAADFCLGNSF